MWHSIKADLDRYRVTDGRSYLTMLILCPGSLACISYRIGNAIWNYPSRFPRLTLPLKVLWILGNRLVEIFTGISIAPTAKIDPGLYIGHFGEIFVGEGVRMGDRKSTRLNSSHQIISYAVFCLKKKNNMPYNDF